MKLSSLQHELEKIAIWYGPDIELAFHGPDDHVEGGFGVAIRSRAVTITRSQGPQIRVLLLEGAAMDGSAEDPGRLEFRIRDAAEIQHGRGAQGRPGDFPPGS